jgi:hypothetical protein
MSELARVAMPQWIRALAASHPFGVDDRRGTTNLIDAAAQARAAGCIRTGESVSLARPLLGGDYNTSTARPGFRHETWYAPAPDGTGWGQDHLVLNPHGLQNTHLDALNHVAVDGTYYGGRPVTEPEQGRRGRGTKVAGALVVSLLAVEGANGVNLNPLIVS